MPEVQITTIDLLRHGRCEGGEIFRGSTDVLLTDSGHRQMRATLAEEGGWQRVISSPMQRCHAFAADYAQQQGLPFAVEADLREIHFGDWEGCTHAEVELRDGVTLQQFWADPETITPPNGESIEDFRKRVIPVLERLQRAHVGEHVLLVTHGAVIRLAMCHWLQLPLRAISHISVPYAGFTRFRIYHQPGQPPWQQLVLHRGDVRLD